MMALAADKLRRLGASVDSVDGGSQQVLGGPLPPTSCHSLYMGHTFPWWGQDGDLP